MQRKGHPSDKATSAPPHCTGNNPTGPQQACESRPGAYRRKTGQTGKYRLAHLLFGLDLPPCEMQPYPAPYQTNNPPKTKFRNLKLLQTIHHQDQHRRKYQDKCSWNALHQEKQKSSNERWATQHF